MTKTVYFHIGTIKTGSTGLQKFCYENRDALLKNDVDYIQFQPPQLHLPRWANADFLLNPDFEPDIVAKMIASSPASRIVISDEALMPRPQIWQHPVFRDIRRVVVLYLRNSVELVASWASENSLPYNFRQLEHASERGVVSVDEGLGFWTMAYRGMLYGFLQAVSSDPDLEVRVKPFPSTLKDETLVESFLGSLDLEDETVRGLAELETAEPVNVGRSRKYCDVSYYLSELVQHYGLEDLYGVGMVDTVYGRLQSGDERKVIDTLNKLDMTFIRNRLATPAEALISELQAPPMIKELPREFSVAGHPYLAIDSQELTQLFLEYVVEAQSGAAN